MNHAASPNYFWTHILTNNWKPELQPSIASAPLVQTPHNFSHSIEFSLKKSSIKPKIPAAVVDVCRDFQKNIPLFFYFYNNKHTQEVVQRLSHQ